MARIIGRIQHVRLGAAAIRSGVVVEVALHQQHILQHVAVCFHPEAQERLFREELREMRRRQRGQPHPFEPQLTLGLLNREPSAAHLVLSRALRGRRLVLVRRIFLLELCQP